MNSLTHFSTSPADRILGWDLLRGLCAVAVCSYHLLSWLEVVVLQAWGHYGVYLFFVLSGASLSYTYGPSWAQRRFSFKDFLVARYFRLAPLFVVLVLAVLPWKLQHETLSLAFLGKLGLNLTFMFGWVQPALMSLLVGGWSLGIEALFYLAFPVLLWCVARGVVGWTLWLALLALQFIWIQATVGSAAGYLANTVTYHHAPAFAAYFMGGCLLGHWRSRSSSVQLNFVATCLLVVSGFVLMVLLNTVDPAEVLTGWRGLILTALCFAMVYIMGAVTSPTGRVSIFAQHLGDATYGLYLIHPIVFFGLTWVLLPRLSVTTPAQQWPMAWRLVLAVSVAVLSFVAAIVSERYFERPLRSKMRLMQNRRENLDAAA